MRRNWIKLYVDQCLRGSMMIELEPAERFIWFGFLLLAGDCAHEGKICATENSGYTDIQISDLLKVDVDLVRRAKKKFIKYEKIQQDENGIIQIVKWHLYQSEYLRQKSYRVKLQGEVTNCSPSISISSSIKEIIEYLNTKTGKEFRADSKETGAFIRARLAEGRTIDDFKKVIDTKVSKWKDKSWTDTRTGEVCQGNDFLRPSTLFRPGNFEAYLNERPATRAKSVTDQGREWAEKHVKEHGLIDRKDK